GPVQVRAPRSGSARRSPPACRPPPVPPPPPPAQCRRAPPAATGGPVCGSQSSLDSGELSAYGPRYTVGSVGPQFRCGGGDGAVHSRVFAFHGFSGAFFPEKSDQKKLMTKGICPRPRQSADTVMKTFQGCWCWRNSYCIGL